MAKRKLEIVFSVVFVSLIASCFECSDKSLHVKTIEFARSSNEPLTLRLDGNDFLFGTSGTEVLKYDSQNRTTESNGSLLLPGGLDVKDIFSSQGISQWKLWNIDTFDADDATWTNAAFSNCGMSSDTFLGGHCKFGHTETARQYEDLPEHRMVRLTARVHYFDQWTGQSVYMKLGNKIVWARSWNWCPQVFSMECARSGVDVCGHEYPDKLSVAVDVEIPHTHSSLRVSFGSTISQAADPCIVSYGVDDVALQLL